jgi:glycolate oxidase FAD binding subunit
VLLWGFDALAAVRILSRALASPHEVSGAAYIPALSTAGLTSVSGSTAVAALRLEGPSPSVTFRRERLLAELGSDCEASSLDDEASVTFWRAVRDVLPLAGSGDRAIWRVSIAPSRGGELGEAITRRLDSSWYLDWAGGLVWAAIAGTEDGGAAVIRDAIRGADGRGTGHATLIKGSPELRRSVPVFEPQPPPLAALARRIKESFDPQRILNPGRIVNGS